MNYYIKRMTCLLYDMIKPEFLNKTSKHKYEHNMPTDHISWSFESNGGITS